MNRIRIGAGAAALALAFTSGATAETTLRVHSWISPKHPQNAVVLPAFARNVEKATNGRVKVKITYPPRVHPKTMFDRAKSGIADITWSFHGYTPGRFVLTQIVELPGLGVSAYEATVAYWKTHQKYLAAANEHAGVKTLLVFTHGPGILQTKKRITKVEDIAGLKIRVAGGMSSEVGKALGVVGILAPANKVYEILSQGVADGIVMPMETKENFKLKEVVPYNLILPGGLYYGSFFMVMNQNTWNRLPRQDQQAIDSVSGAALAEISGRAWAKGDKVGYDAAKAAGNELTVADPKLAADIEAKLAGLEAAWLKKASAKIDAAAALAYLRAEAYKLKK